MSGSIQGTGSQQPVDYSSASAGEGIETSKAVGSGVINGNARVQMMQGEKAVTRSQLEHRPTLLKPENMSVKAQAAATSAASEDLAGLGKVTRDAAKGVGSAMMRIQVGMQTPEDQQWLQKNAASFEGTAKYLKSLQNGEDKQLLLGGQGFDDQQIEDLMLSQTNRTALTNKLKAKYGDAFNQKKADLIAMGYDDHQADMILSLGDDNLMRSDLRKAELKKIFKDSPEGQKLAELGFGEKKIKELLALINKGDKPGDSFTENQKLKDLLGKMGFSEKEAGILLATGDKDKIKNQLMLMNQLESNPEMIEKLESWAQQSRLLTSSPNKPYLEEHLKQLADIFMVLELIHNMSVKQRRFAREMRSAEYDAAKAEVLKQADHIRMAAAFTFAADLTQGALTMGGGFASMKSGWKGAKAPKGGAKSTADDVEVSSPGGKKQGKSAKGKKGKSTARQDNVEQNGNTQQQNKANQKKNMEKDAQKADQKRADRETETQQQDAAQRKQNKEDVTEEQNKAADDNQSVKKESTKSQENSNEMMANSNQGMMINSLTSGAGQFLGGGFKFAASQYSALQKESEARQKTHENAAQAWSEWMQLQQDMVKTCQSKIDEINRIHFDTLKSLSRG
ncbi:hypothetical protein [Endozoicomonas sp. Mp262]|uniref:hypothetical protein n=1 Tax=Endozoicomonas sp. Mp262 TaxID=2919499 RepID=UPI0021D99476